MNSTQGEKNRVRFPRIESKPRSLPGDRKLADGLLDDVTAKSWLCWTPDGQFGYKTNSKREIASLTKIMTSLCALELCEKYKMNRQTTYFKVTGWASSTNGTTASLLDNAWMSVEDLLYGLMLPSGNDAAMVLAENLGAVIYFDKAGNKSLIQEIRSIDLSEDRESIKFYMHEFVCYMNEKCHRLKMYKTRFSNPHGLDMLNNYSCCDDVLLLANEAMLHPDLRKIVKTHTYKGTFKFFREGKVVCKPAHWTNTNKLLSRPNVIGLKTGVTSKAGGCLATAFVSKSGQQWLVVVLGCATTEDRFRDTVKIMNWAEEEFCQS